LVTAWAFGKGCHDNPGQMQISPVCGNAPQYEDSLTFQESPHQDGEVSAPICQRLKTRDDYIPQSKVLATGQSRYDGGAGKLGCSMPVIENEISHGLPVCAEFLSSS